jgi:hypothetical protein
MGDLLVSRVFQIGAGIGGSIALILGVVIGLLVAPEPPEGSLLGPVTVTTGGSTRPRSDEAFAYQFAADIIDLPLTTADAVAAGWKDPVFCSPGRGRYFTKGPAGDADPYVLMYNDVDELIGLYLYIKSEMPPPWDQLDELLGGGGSPIVDFEHWGLFVYFQDSVLACRVSRSKGTSFW